MKMGEEKFMKKLFRSKKYIKLKVFSKERNIKCFASAFNLEGARLLKKTGDKWIKNTFS